MARIATSDQNNFSRFVDYKNTMISKDAQSKYITAGETNKTAKTADNGVTIPSRRFGKKPVAEAVKRYQSGETLAAIGERFGLTRNTVRRALQRSGVKMRSEEIQLMRRLPERIATKLPGETTRAHSVHCWRSLLTWFWLCFWMLLVELLDSRREVEFFCFTTSLCSFLERIELTKVYCFVPESNLRNPTTRA